MFVLNSNVKGAIAEQAIVLAATKLRIPVLRPVNEHGRSISHWTSLVTVASPGEVGATQTQHETS